MQKALVFALALLACSASAQNLEISDKDALQFFNGFSASFNLEQAYSNLIECSSTDIPQFVDGIKILIGDLFHEQWLPAIGDFLQLYFDLKAIETVCPAGVEPYINEFGAAFQAARANQGEFWKTVEKDLLDNLVGSALSGYMAIKNILDHNWEATGTAFGTLTSIGLSAYLPNNEDAIGNVEINKQDALQFFYGFSTSLNLEDAYNALLNCAGNDLPNILNEAKALFSDLKAKNWLGAIGDALSIWFSTKAALDDCPNGISPYIATFGPAFTALKSNPKAFFQQVEKDLLANLMGTALSAYETGLNLLHHNYQIAGGFFGSLTGIGLSAYLSQPESAVDYYEATEYQFPEYEFTGESVFESFSEFQSSEPEGDTSAEEFLEGFASVYGLQNASQALIVCATNDTTSLFQDIDKLINDLKTKDWTAVIGDCVQIFTDVKQLQATCPQGADPFLTEFQPAFQAYQANSQQFMTQVGKNVKSQLVSFIKDSAEMVLNLKDNNFEDAGQDFGEIGQIALVTWLNTTMI